MKKTFLSIFIILFSIAAYSQASLKIGHINSQELLQAMPENDSALAKIERATKEAQSQMETMQVELNSKYQDYITKRDSYSELIKQTKETELQQMNQRIQQFQTTADQDLQKQRTELYKPILDKANNAISEVGKANGFTYILDLSSGIVLYHAENSIDILPLVKQKLGLK
jgi:outer membrane protein